MSTTGTESVQPDHHDTGTVVPGGSAETDLVPATLDLADRARLAVNAMTEATDPQEDYRVYLEGDLQVKSSHHVSRLFGYRDSGEIHGMLATNADHERFKPGQSR